MSSPCQSALKRHVDAARQIQREKNWQWKKFNCTSSWIKGEIGILNIDMLSKTADGWWKEVSVIRERNVRGTVSDGWDAEWLKQERKRPGTDRVMQQESKRYKSEKTPTNICTGSFQKVWSVTRARLQNTLREIWRKQVAFKTPHASRKAGEMNFTVKNPFVPFL